MKLVPEDRLTDYLHGSLNFAGTIIRPNALREALVCYRHLLASGHSHLPFFLVYDILEIVTHGYNSAFRTDGRPPPSGDDDEHQRESRAIRSRYERECLGRLLQAPEVASATEIVETTPDPGLRRRLLELLLASLAPCYPRIWQLNPSHLRGFQWPVATGDSPEEFLSRFELACPGSQSFGEALEQFLNRMNDEVHWGTLLQEEDLFELSHFSNLSTDYLRIGSRQLIELNRKLESGLPQDSLKPNEEEVDTAFLDETHYPTGGFSGLTNRGSFENLLTSELAYMDEGIENVSLFDLRYVEQELLFYLRDAGNLRRKRRTIHFIFDLGPLIETKSIGYEYQYSVLLHAMALRFIDDLFGLFELDSLRFKFHHLCGEAQQEYAEGEIGLLQTVLADYIRHGWVQFELGHALSLGELPDPKRKTYAVVFSSPDRFRFWEKQAQAALDDELPLHFALCQVGRSSGSPLDLPAKGLDLSELRRRKDAILKTLVS